MASETETNVKNDEESNNKVTEDAPEKDTSGDKESVESNGAGVESSEDLIKKIVKQIEYYFGNFNLPRDRFLSEEIQKDDGWVQLDVMIKFKRLADLSKDHDVIRKALKNSELIEVDDAKDRIRRTPDNPAPLFGDDLRAETVKRTIYCKGFPKDGSINLDMLLEFFKPYGPFENIHMRHYFDKGTKRSGFKGSILVVFPSVEKAKEFVEIDDIPFKGRPLLRKWHSDYLQEKTEEIEERKARKKTRLELLQKGEDGKNDPNAPKLSEINPIPAGSFIFLEGFNATSTREDIKESLSDFTQDVAFVDYSKGNSSAYVRLGTGYSSEDLVKKIGETFKVNDADISVRVVEGDEEQEQIEKAEEARFKTYSNRGKKRKFRGRGGFRGNKKGRF